MSTAWLTRAWWPRRAADEARFVPKHSARARQSEASRAGSTAPPTNAPPAAAAPGRLISGDGQVRAGGHVRSLDGIRALAIISVVAYHLDFVHHPAQHNPLHPTGGWLGVDVFYVLSGYLISTLLIAEYDRRGGIRFRGFYARRVLRLYPALAAVLVVVGLACLYWHTLWWSAASIHVIPFVLLYVVNWGAASHNSTSWLGAFGQTWSLAIEEQFYLVWPAVCLVLLRLGARRRLVALGCLGLAAAETWWRWHLALHGAGFDRLYYGTDTHSDNLFVGCALAFFLSSIDRDRIGAAWWRYLAWAGAIVGAAAAPWLYLYASFDRYWTWLWIPATGYATALVLFGLLTYPLHPLRLLLGIRPLQWLGKRSYGLYLWHYPVIVVASTLGAYSWERPTPAYRACLVAISLAFTIVSYRVVELPFLRLKDRMSTRARSQPAIASASTRTGRRPAPAGTVRRLAPAGVGREGAVGRRVRRPRPAAAPARQPAGRQAALRRPPAHVASAHRVAVEDGVSRRPPSNATMG